MLAEPSSLACWPHGTVRSGPASAKGGKFTKGFCALPIRVTVPLIASPLGTPIENGNDPSTTRSCVVIERKNVAGDVSGLVSMILCAGSVVPLLNVPLIVAE